MEIAIAVKISPFTHRRRRSPFRGQEVSGKGMRCEAVGALARSPGSCAARGIHLGRELARGGVEACPCYGRRLTDGARIRAGEREREL